MDNNLNYRKIALDARKTVLRMIYQAQTSHVGSNFSCIDIMTVLFKKIDLKKNKVVLSKGWAAASLYYFLWKKGRITEKELNSFCQPGSKFIGLTEPIIPEIPFAGGSIGMGLPAGLGFALAKKLNKQEGKVYVLMSDGEMQSGTTWESALIASHHKLDNLIVIVDANELQAMGKVKDILNIEPLKEKWQTFGWEVREIDGHNFEEIEKAISLFKQGKPLIIIARTIKGMGWKRAEGDNLYHYKSISKKEYEEALEELNKQYDYVIFK